MLNNILTIKALKSFSRKMSDHMIATETLLTVSISFLIGFLYECLFSWYLKKFFKTFFLHDTGNPAQTSYKLMLFSLFAFVRIGLLVVAWYYLLRSKIVNDILSVISFAAGFIVTLLIKKVFPNAWSSWFSR